MPKLLLPLCLVISAILSSTSYAQSFSDISRWTGGTASSQAQGFSQGDPLKLTWGFVNDGLNIPSFGAGSSGPSDLDARFSSIYGSTAAYTAVFGSTFDRWSALSGLEYQFQSTDDNATFQSSGGATGVRADIRIGGRRIDGNSGILAFNFFPGDGGDMVIDTDDSFFENLSSSSLRTRNVVAHEHGHGIGMDHITAPSAGTFLMQPFVSTAFDGPQMHDILLAHRGYGDVNEKSFAQLGNDVFSRATDLGTIASGDTNSIGNDARDLLVNPNEIDFVSIDDATDTDFFSFTVDQNSIADFLLESLGVTYDVGGAAFDLSMRSNLALDVFDTDGTTLLGSIDANGLGGNESLNGITLANAGTYFVRITGADNADSIGVDTQFFGLSVSVSAVPEPSSFVVMSLIGLATVSRRRYR